MFNALLANGHPALAPVGRSSTFGRRATSRVRGAERDPPAAGDRFVARIVERTEQVVGLGDNAVAADHVGVTRRGNRGQDRDHRDRDHQLDQPETPAGHG